MEHLRLFSENGQLELVVMKIVGLLQKMQNGHQSVVIIKYRYQKLTRAVTLMKIYSMYVLSIFFDHRITPYRILGYIAANMAANLSESYLTLYEGFRESSIRLQRHSI